MKQPKGEPKNGLTKKELKELHNFDCQINDSSINVLDNDSEGISINQTSGYGHICLSDQSKEELIKIILAQQIEIAELKDDLFNLSCEMSERD